MVHRVHVQVGIEFLQRHLETAAFKQAAGLAAAIPFPKRGNDASRYEYVFGHLSPPFIPSAFLL